MKTEREIIAPDGSYLAHIIGPLKRSDLVISWHPDNIFASIYSWEGDARLQQSKQFINRARDSKIYVTASSPIASFTHRKGVTHVITSDRRIKRIEK